MCNYAYKPHGDTWVVLMGVYMWVTRLTTPHNWIHRMYDEDAFTDKNEATNTVADIRFSDTGNSCPAAQQQLKWHHKLHLLTKSVSASKK